MSNNFELLLALACQRCAEEDAQEFLNIDTSTITVTEREHRRAMKIIKRAERKPLTPWVVIKYAFVACLLIMSICFTACICIPKIRQAITDAFVEWRNGYIAVGFTNDTTPMEEETFTNPQETGSDTETTVTTEASTNVNGSSNSSGTAGAENSEAEASTEATEPTTPTPEPSPEPEPSPQTNPTTIEKKAYATYLPSGYTAKTEIDDMFFHMIGFYESEQIKFSLLQSPILEDLSWLDSETQTVSKVFVNNFAAVLTTEKQSNTIRSLVWQAYGYEFTLSGEFSTIDDIINIAQGITV